MASAYASGQGCLCLAKRTFNLSRSAGRQQEEKVETSPWINIKLNSPK